MKQAIAVLGCGVLAVGASACESTESESAKIGRDTNNQIANAGTVKLGAINHDVRIAHVSLLSSAGRSAVAVQLTATSRTPQVEVPVLVNVTGTGGKLLYSNDTEGIESSLQHMPVLLPGHSEWWVDDQVLTNQSTTGVHVQLGRSSKHRAKAIGGISANVARLGKQAGVSVLEGTLLNSSATSADKVTVFAVALEDGRVTAAGRAVVPTLAAHSSGVPFQIFLVGNPAGASTQLTVVATGR